MRKPVIDYRKVRLSNITGPEFRHLFSFVGWIVYLQMFAWTERNIDPLKCWVAYSPLDSKIPFNEWFIIPYVSWYILMWFAIFYFLLYKVDTFKGMSKYILFCQIVAIISYVWFPSRQDLRPAGLWQEHPLHAVSEFPRSNIATWAVKVLYTTDTNTGVCPSLHVAYSLAVASAWGKDPTARKWVKATIWVWGILICISTVFVKQHSVVDVFAALVMCIFAELIAFWPYWKKKFHNRFAK